MRQQNLRLPIRAERDELSEILRGPLPALPGCDTHSAAGRLRRVCGREAVAVWRHPTWGALVGWIGRLVPDADPVAPAVAAIRRAGDLAPADLARYVLAAARHSTTIRDPSSIPLSDATVEELAESPLARRAGEDSLWREARELLDAAGVTLTSPMVETVAASIDIAVDWWDRFAERSGLTGDALVHAVRHSAGVSKARRLRSLFDGPQARPLVTLLLGDGQLGRRVRETAGVEAGLVYWALAARHAERVGVTRPQPPSAVTAGWAAMLGLVQRALAAGDGSAPGVSCYARAVSAGRSGGLGDGCHRPCDV